MKGLETSGDRVIARDRVIGKITPTALSQSPSLRSEAVLCVSRLPGSLRHHDVVPITGSRPIPRSGITRSQYALHVVRQVPRWLQATCQVFLAALREIFDENAYERFLARTQDTRSARSYRAFLRERENATAQKPRCC